MRFRARPAISALRAATSSSRGMRSTASALTSRLPSSPRRVVFGSFELIRGNGIKQITQAKATLAQFVSPGTNPLDDQRNSAEADQQRPLRLIDPLGKRELLAAGEQLGIVEVTEVRIERVTRARRIVDLIRDAAGGGCAISAHGHAGFEPVRVQARDLNRSQLVWRARKRRRRPDAQRRSGRTPLQIDSSASNPFDQIPPGAPGIAAGKSNAPDQEEPELLGFAD